MTDAMLRFFDMFKWVFKLLKVDYPQFRAILKVKFANDNRRLYANYNPMKLKGNPTNTMLKSLGINFLIGIFFGVLVAFLNHLLLSMLVAFSFIMMMASMLLISDFTSVLLDTRDNTILLPRPVDSRTVLMSRVAHIAVYIFLVTLSLGFGSLVVGTFKFGLFFFPVMLTALIFTSILVVFLTNLFYMLIMKFVDGETFKDVILYFQILTGALLFGSMQILPRVFDIKALKTITISLNWWAYFFPPAWMAGTTDALVNGNFTGTNVILMVLMVTAPLAGLFVVIRYLGPGFNRRLAQMDVTGQHKESKRKRKGILNIELSDLFSRIFTYSPSERNGFRMTWLMSGRDKLFKLNVYPSIGGIFIIIYIIIFHGKREEVMKSALSLPDSQRYLFLIYTGGFLIFMALILYSFSEHPRGAWVYKAAPLDRPGAFLAGSLKAVIIRHSFPFLIIIPFIIGIWGFQTINDIILSLLNISLFAIVFSLITDRSFPFSRQKTAMQTDVSTKLVPSIVSIVLLLGLMLVHYFYLLPNETSVTIACAATAAVLFPLFHLLKKSPWEKVTLEI